MTQPSITHFPIDIPVTRAGTPVASIDIITILTPIATGMVGILHGTYRGVTAAAGTL
jgi:hypothetical protein